MTKNARANKLKKKDKSLELKQLFTSTKGSKSPRLEMKIKKNLLVKGGSAYTAVIAKRDDMEVRGVIASLGGQSLEDLKKKYKKYKLASNRGQICKEG